MEQKQGRLAQGGTSIRHHSSDVSPPVKSRYTALIFLFGLLWLCPLWAATAYANTQIAIILSGDNPAYTQLADSFSQQIVPVTTPITIQRHWLNSDTAPLPPEIRQAKFVVCIGRQATRKALLTPLEGGIITAFVTRNALQNLVATQQPTANNTLVGGVYLDQPAARLLHTAQLLTPGNTHIGLLTGDLSGARLPEFTSQAKNLGVTLNTGTLTKDDNPLTELENLIAHSDSYIVLPDRNDFNRATAKWIIYLSYRYGIPVIGYSSRYVDAGALVSVFSTPAQLAQQTAELVMTSIAGNVIAPQWEYPRYYQLRINSKVARSLGYSQLSEAGLLRQLILLEKSSPLAATRQEGTTPDE